MPLCSLEQFLAEQLSGSTFKVLLDVMFLYSRNALKVAFLDGGSWFFFTSHKSASLGKKPKINKDYSIYRFLFPAIGYSSSIAKNNFKIDLCKSVQGYRNFTKCIRIAILHAILDNLTFLSHLIWPEFFKIC